MTKPVKPEPILLVGDPGATWCVPGETLEASLERCKRIIRAGKDAGLDVVKFQLVRRQMYPIGAKEYDLISQYELPDAWLPLLKSYCDDAGIEFACTVYRPEDVALIDPLVKRHKIASFESYHRELVQCVLAAGKPTCISLGLGHSAEKCLAALSYEERMRHWEQITWLHCTSAYPAEPEQMNMARMLRLLPNRGFSDHSKPFDGAVAACMAVALGARVIEKHFRLDETDAGNPDYAHSLTPFELSIYVHSVRTAEMMHGHALDRAVKGELHRYAYDPATGRRGA